ncbi:MAG: NmrA family NAD(P)-binding protein [Novosphingobium sp.]
MIDALRTRDPEANIRGLCRYPHEPARAIETVPGNLDTGAKARAIETVPGNLDTGTRKARAIETVPGNLDTRTATARGIETVPGNLDTGTQKKRAIELVVDSLEGSIAVSRAIETVPGNLDTGTRRAHAIVCLTGDLENPVDRAKAVEGIDIVIHYAPAFHPRETAIGTGMIDAAVAAGVSRFIYVSTLHAQVASVPGHAAKLVVEAYLAESNLEWTILRPQNYMQNIDVSGVLATHRLDLPFPLTMRQNYLDIADLAEVVAKVADEDGHAFATYDLANDEALSTVEIAALITTVSGQPVNPGELPVAQLVAGLETAGPAFAYVADAVTRLNAWQARSGGRGNPGALRWLLGREPASFEDYVRRSLSE